jgi:ferritin
MLISERLASAMNEQIGRELGASNQYLNIAAYFDAQALPELAAFFYRQADEERMHALKLLHYIVEAGGQVAVPAVAKVKADIASAEEAAQLSLDWELEVTQQINALMTLASEEKDYIGQDFLRWFVTEQLEEVSTMDELLTVIQRAGEGGLMFVEAYLNRRGDPHAEGG